MRRRTSVVHYVIDVCFNRQYKIEHTWIFTHPLLSIKRCPSCLLKINCDAKTKCISLTFVQRVKALPHFHLFKLSNVFFITTENSSDQ